MLCFYLCAYVLIISTDISRGELRTPPAGMTLHKTSMSWEDADRKCKREGAVLASPISDEVLDAMKSLMGLKNTSYFIGIKADYFTGPFTSVEGVPLESMSLAVMDMIDTTDQLNGDCLAMNSDSIQAVPCYSRLPFMCYNAKDFIATKNKDLQCGPVHEGYKYNEPQRNCYKMHDVWVTWEQAKQTCVDEGGHLVIIDNKKEARTVMKMMGNAGWTWTWGGFIYRSDNWVTLHGDAVDDLFNTWWGTSGPPYDSSFCGRFHDFLLGWWKCDKTQRFICEKMPKNY